MYDHIVGEVRLVQPAQVVLRAGGVGYVLQVPMGVSATLSNGQEACLFTILHVTDGNPTLLGFTNREDRDFARLLMSVSGVGPAMALAIQSTYTMEHYNIVADWHEREVGTVETRRSSSLPCTRCMMRPSWGRRRSAIFKLAIILIRLITAAVELAGGDSVSCSTPSIR